MAESLGSGGYYGLGEQLLCQPGFLEAATRNNKPLLQLKRVESPFVADRCLGHVGVLMIKPQVLRGVCVRPRSS